MEKIQKGLSFARKSSNPFLPSPGEFCSWCLPKPEDIGLQSVEEAFNHAREECGKYYEFRTWENEVVYLASKHVGIFELKSTLDTGPQIRDLRKRFTKIYTDFVEKKMSGENLDADIPRIEKKPRVESTSKTKVAGENTISTLKSLFGGDDE